MVRAVSCRNELHQKKKKELHMTIYDPFHFSCSYVKAAAQNQAISNLEMYSWLHAAIMLPKTFSSLQNSMRFNIGGCVCAEGSRLQNNTAKATFCRNSTMLRMRKARQPCYSTWLRWQQKKNTPPFP